METSPEKEHRTGRRVSRVLILCGLALLGAGRLLLLFSVSQGIAGVISGSLVAGIGFVLEKKPEYLILLGM